MSVFSRLIGWSLFVAGADCALVLVIAPWFIAPDLASLAPASITSVRGAAYFVHLPRDRGKVLRPSGDVGVSFPAPMQLLENGTSIGRPARGFDEVMRKAPGGSRTPLQCLHLQRRTGPTLVPMGEPMK